MLDVIRNLIALLSRDPLSIEEVSAYVGSVDRDPGGLMPIELRSALPGVQAASLGRNPDNGLPELLTIEFASETALTARDLRQAFGAYQRLRTDRGQPPSIILHPPAAGSRWKIALIADLRSTGIELDDQPVTEVTLRRNAATP
jgi:hypothetical protein